MSAATAPKLMTAEEFLALPDDGVERYLIRGELREVHPDRKGRDDVTIRNRHHCRVTMRIGQILLNWLDRQPEPRGQVVGGEAGFILRHDPDSTVGIDVAYVSADTISVQTEDTTVIDGLPILAIEILSPTTTHRSRVDKVKEYLRCGVAVVWVVDPDFASVTVHRPGVPAAALDARDTLAGDPELPGFACPVADLFR